MFIRLFGSIINLRWEVICITSLILYSHLISLRRFLYRPFTKRLPLIHIIGDSHIFSFTGQSFYIHYIPLATAHNLIKEISGSNSRNKILKILGKIKNPQEKLIILVFGEIDCRIQIYNHYHRRGRKITMKRLIRQTVKNYGQFVSQLRNKKMNVALLNVLPPGEQSNIYNFPYYADRRIRWNITKQFNKQLQNWCRRHQIPFIAIFDKLVDTNSKRKQVYSLDEVHYNNLSKILLRYIQRDRHLSNFLKGF